MKTRRKRRRFILSEEEQRIFDRFCEGQIDNPNDINILVNAASEQRVNTYKLKKALRDLNKK